MEALKKLKTEILYDPTIPLLCIYSEKNIIPRDICTLMFIASLFTMTRMRKQLKCPSTEEWKKKSWQHVYSGILLSHRKEVCHWQICGWT